MDRHERPGELGNEQSSSPRAVAPKRARKSEDKPLVDAHAYLRGRLGAAKSLAEGWPKARRIRALQELLLDIQEVVNHTVDELEAIRSGKRFSEREDLG